MNVPGTANELEICRNVWTLAVVAPKVADEWRPEKSRVPTELEGCGIPRLKSDRLIPRAA